MRVFRKLSVVLLVTFAFLSFADIFYGGLWSSGYKKTTGLTAPGVITKNGGNIVVVSGNGKIIELTVAGGEINHTQVSGIFNIVAPASFQDFQSNGQFVIYATAQQGNNYVVFHRLNGQISNSSRVPIPGASYGITTYASGTSHIVAFATTLNGSVVRIEQPVSLTNPATVSVNLPGSNVTIKTPPVLSPNRQYIYVLTSTGLLYRLNASNLSGQTLIATIGDSFSTQMAMDESGYLYLFSDNGLLYKIDPSQTNQTNLSFVRFHSSGNSVGPIIDGDGRIYLFGDNGKLVILNKNQQALASYTIGQSVTAVPGILRGTDGKIYLVVPTSANGFSGKINILSFDGNSTISLVAQFVIDSSFPLAGSVNIAPLGALNVDHYYFALADSMGNVYSFRTDAKGPYGIWSLYGANSYRTNAIDPSAILFRTRIYLYAVEGYNGRPLSSQITGSQNSGLLYYGRIINSDNTVASTGTYRTNITNPAANPQGIPGSQSLVVRFSTPTELALLLRGNFITNVVKGGTPPATDSWFRFKYWNLIAPDAYEGNNEAHNPATLTFYFSDRNVKIYTDATYTYYVYHKYPLATNNVATRVIYGLFDYNTFRTNPAQAKVTINASNTNQGTTFYAYMWKVYQWDPSELIGYKLTTWYDRDSLELPLSGPHYIEIYYAQLSATVTLVLPEFAYKNTKAYLYLDVATNTLAHIINLKTKNGVTIKTPRLETLTGVSELPSLRVNTQNELKYVLENLALPLSAPTRIATLTLYLDFPVPTSLFSNNNDLFLNYFDLYGYTQVQGQLVDPNLRAKNVFRLNKFMYLPGDFNDDWAVDINDWLLFRDKLGSTVSGADIAYNIGPRTDFTPPYPTLNDFRSGLLSDQTNKVDDNDLMIFVSMFGFAVPNNLRN